MTRDRWLSSVEPTAFQLRFVSILIQPFMTETPKKIWAQLGITEEQTKWDTLQTFGTLVEGTELQKGEPIFPRLEVEKEVAHIVEQMGGVLVSETASTKQEEPKKKDDIEEITIDDFSKVDLRVAEVIKAEQVENADKLLKIQLDLGDHQRQVISGIAKYYKPEEFEELKKIALEKGFSHCESGPLVRSSYHADEQINEAQYRREANQ